MDHPYTPLPDLGVNDQMAGEARSIVDSARERGVVLRLLGGFAVHEHCGGSVACLRPHADIDMVGLGRQRAAVVGLFGEAGFGERIHVREATQLGQAQFMRRCLHLGLDGAVTHEEDHVDVFFDHFRMDHVIDLRARLELHPYALPRTDTLATKLQMHAPEPRDVRDALMLLATARAEGSGADAVDAEYLGRLCAHDWGLFYDVALNLQRCTELLAHADLSAAERDRAAVLLVRLTGAIDGAPKTLAWRLRARVGTRRSWWDTVEEQGGVPS